MLELLMQFGQWFRDFQYQTAMAIVATVLVIFGNDINNIVRKLIRKQNFVVRTIIFTLVCAFGYGLLTVWLSGLVSAQLSHVPNQYILPLIFSVFSSLGFYAQKHKHI